MTALWTTLVLSVVLTGASHPPRRFYTDVYGLRQWTTISHDVGPSVVPYGEVVTLGEWFGLYPCIGCGSYGPATWCNGGVPQLANLSAHAAAMATDLRYAGIQDPSTFTGFLILDWEEWHPVWELTPARYQNASMTIASRQLGPGATPAATLSAAMSAYQNASLQLMEFTAVTLVRLCPRARGVGFYGFPSLYGYWVNVTQAQIYNDGPLWSLWRVINVFAPSIYLPYKSNVDVSYARNLQYVTGVVNETLRLKRLMQESYGDAKTVLPYAWYRYHPGEPHGMQFLDALDAHLEYRVPLDVGADGVIMWGDATENATDAADVKSWYMQHRDVFNYPNTSDHHSTWHQRSDSRTTTVVYDDHRDHPKRLRNSQPIDKNGDAPFPPSWTTCSL